MSRAAVKARGEARRARSDWMKIEQQRGISVTTSVMHFEYGGAVFNLLDTPGHEDFSEDTYRTLTCGRFGGDGDRRRQGHRGAHPQAVRDLPPARRADRHLHQQARPRGQGPDRAFGRNRLDPGARRGAHDLAHRLGPGFKGTYDLANSRMLVFDSSDRARIGEIIENYSIDDPKLAEEVELVRAAYPVVRHGGLSRRPPDAGVLRQRLQQFRRPRASGRARRLGAAAAPQPAEPRAIEPTEPKVSGFVFKVQANMDPNHRDRIAFLRLCSGKFRRGMKLTQMGTARRCR
jgi:peptide chain release factor 3